DGPGQPDAAGLAGYVQDAAGRRLGRADGRLDARRDPRRAVRDRAAGPDRLRCRGRRGQGMRLEALADAVLLPGFGGTAPPDWVRRRVAGGLGGVVLFARNCVSPTQRAERADVLVATDEEGGDVTRLFAAVGSPVPSPYALGVADDVELTRSVAAALAARLAAAGIGWALAPVADVNSAPDNPVIGVRSYGAMPALVARHVAAAVRGIQSAGVAACAKHFPGHGDASVDSHLGLATVGPDLAGALEPFRAAVAAGVATVMTGHLLVPGYGDLPATLNPALVDGLL